MSSRGPLNGFQVDIFQQYLEFILPIKIPSSDYCFAGEFLFKLRNMDENGHNPIRVAKQ